MQSMKTKLVQKCIDLLKYFLQYVYEKNYRGTYSTNTIRCAIKHAID